MKIKFRKLVGLLVVLGMVVSLMTIVAAPASANVSAVTVTPAPATANDAAGYTVAFTVGAAGALTGNVSTITIKFPSDTILPSSIAKENASVNGTVCLVAPSVNTTDRTVTLITPVSVANSGAVSVVIAQTAGIKNPSLAATTYNVQVYTSVETTAVDSSPYAITATVSFTPAAGAAGATVTVTGGGFYPGSGVTMTGGATGAGDVLSDGKFSVACQATASGQIVAVDGTGRTATSAATFNLLPTLTVVPPASGNVGAPVNIQGRNFTVGGNISALANATFGGTALGALYMAGSTTLQIGVVFTDLDLDGNADDFNAWFYVPDSQNAGSTEISITDSGGKVGKAYFTVNPRTLEVGPTSGAPGITVTVTGGGFKTSSAATGTITLGQGIGVVATDIATDGNGGFTEVITIPGTAIAGSLSVMATIGGCTKTAYFTVTGNVLNLSSSSGPKGSYVTVWGSGMTASGHITSLKIGTVSLTYTGTITIDTAGNIQAVTATIPAGAAWGTQVITAIDSGPKTATATYTVQQPSIAISPSEGYMGDSVTVSGTGWLAGARGMVTITITGGTAPIIAVPNDDGSLRGLLTVPVTGVVGPRTVTIAATDSIPNVAVSKTFMVKSASISVSPASQAATQTVTLTGIGFTPQSPVSAVTIAGATINTTPNLVVTDAVGKFTCTFVVPGLVGVKTIAATVPTDTRTTFLTITAAPVTVGVQTANISSQLVRIWGYSDGTWHMYDPATPALNDLPILESTNGYWFKVTETCTLVYGGFSKVMSGSDWTLVGWP